MNRTRITWLGHSCFMIEKDGYRIVLDPYEDGKVPGLAPLRLTADKVLASHGHADHFAPGVVRIREGAEEKVCPFEITELHSFHDEQGGALRGENVIRIFSDGVVKIAHMGDIGCRPSEEQMEALKGLSVMLVPVGGHFTMEPEKIRELVAELRPLIVVPMHYRSDSFGFGVIRPLADYTAMCGDTRVYDRGYLLLPDDLAQQTAVLTYAPAPAEW